MSTYIPVVVTQETQILNIEVSYGRIIEADTEWAMQISTNQSIYASGKHGMDEVLRILTKGLRASDYR